jgi:hypothetical protein
VKDHQEARQHDEKVDTEIRVANDWQRKSGQNMSMANQYPQGGQAAQSIKTVDTTAVANTRHAQFLYLD